MATDLTGLQVRNTYNSLLKIGDNTSLTGIAKRISDGLGNDSPLFISTSQISIGVAPATGYDLTVNSGIRTGSIDILGAATAQSLQFTGGGGTQGTMSWNTDEETVDLIQNGATLQLGQETHVHVKNQSGATINDGTPVYVTGTLGASGRLTVAPMIADGSIEAKYFLGVTTEDIPNGEDGKVTTFGKIRGLNTSAYAPGTTLYVSSTTAGFWQTTPPVSPALDLEVAIVINQHANNGTLFVRAQNGQYLGLLHDVYLNSVADNQLLVYNATNSRWENQGIASIGAINLDTVTDNGNTTTNSISVGDINAGNVTLTGYLRGAANFVIDPAAHGDETGVVQILGDLRVDGTTTTINSTTVTIADKNIVLAQGSALPGDANGAGITIDGAAASMTYNSTSDRFVFNKDIETNLVGNVTGDLTGNADTASTLETARNIAVDGAVTGNADFDGSGDITITTTVNHNHDDRYYTETESDNRFVNVDGDTMTGDLDFNDDVKAKFGTGDDLTVYHNATNSLIDNATGSILIRNLADDQDIVLASDDGAGSITDYLRVDGSEGSVNLYHYGSKKLETTATGVSVTGAFSGNLDTSSISGSTIDINGTTRINLQYNGTTQAFVDSTGFNISGGLALTGVDGISLTDEDSTTDSYFHANTDYDAGIYTITSNARYGADYIQIDGLDSRSNTRFTISPKDIGDPDPFARLYIGGDNSNTSPNTLVDWHTIEMNALSVQINNAEVATQTWANNAFVNVTGDSINGELTITKTIGGNGIYYPFTIQADDTGNNINQLIGDGIGLQFKLANNETAGGSFLGGSIAAVRESATDTDSSTSLEFYTSNNDETLDKKLTINSVGSLTLNASASETTISGDTSGNIYFNNTTGEHRFRANGSTVNSVTISSSAFVVNEATTINADAQIDGHLSILDTHSLYMFAENGAKVNIDARGDGTGAMLHKWNRNLDDTAYLAYYENWYDGNSYHQIGIEADTWRIGTRGGDGVLYVGDLDASINGALDSNKQGIVIQGTGGRLDNPQDGNERLPVLQFFDSVTNYGSNTATQGESRGGVEWYSSETSSNFPAVVGAIYSINENTYNTQMGLGFYTNYNQTAPTEKLRIGGAGEVNIVSGDLQIGGTTVIDSSRAANFQTLQVAGNSNLSGTVTIDTGSSSVDALVIRGDSPTINFIDDNSAGSDDFYIHVNSNNFYVLRDTAGSDTIGTGWDSPHPLQLEGDTNIGYLFGSRIFADNYHPNADKWTSARTITLGGDLTGSVSIDGSSNVTLSAQVVNDSHTHDGRYYTEGETDTIVARSLGWVPAYDNADENTVQWNDAEQAVRLYSGSDSSIGMAYKAIRMKAGDKARFTVMIRSAFAATQGLYVRLYFHSGDLPDGKTHVSHNAATSSVYVQEDDFADSGWYENGSLGTAWQNFERTYTAPADGYVSLVILNWTGIGTGAIYVKQPDIQFEKVNQATSADDSTKVNINQNDTFSGTYPLAWTDNNLMYSSTWMTVTGATDTLNVPNIYASSKVRIGTTATDYPLNIQANSGSNAIRIIGRSDDIGSIVFANSTNNTNQAFIQSRSNELRISPYAGNLKLYSGNGERVDVNGDGIIYMARVSGKPTIKGNNLYDSHLIIDSASSNDAVWLQNYNSGNVYMVTGGGKVGIGTTTVSEKLTISGGISLTGNINFGSSNGDIHLSRGSYISFYEDTSTNHSISSRNGAFSEADDIRINSYGSVLINLDSNNNNTSSANLSVGRHGASGTISDWLFVVDGETGAGTFKGDVIAFGSPSDISLKENIKPIEGALDKVKKLQGVTFDWKQNDDDILKIKEDYGFIAQEVQEVLPELVRENENGKLSLRDKGIISVLVEAIKEQQKQIDELKARLDA